MRLSGGRGREGRGQVKRFLGPPCSRVPILLVSSEELIWRSLSEISLRRRRRGRRTERAWGLAFPWGGGLASQVLCFRWTPFLHAGFLPSSSPRCISCRAEHLPREQPCPPLCFILLSRSSRNWAGGWQAFARQAESLEGLWGRSGGRACVVVGRLKPPRQPLEGGRGRECFVARPALLSAALSGRV